MKCFMFPGQPLSPGAPLPDDADGRHLTALFRRQTGFDLSGHTWLEAPGSEQLKCQLFGLAHSLYRLRQLQRQGVRPGVVAQHSMGIYAALVACGCLGEAQAIEMTWRVGTCLARMGLTRESAFGCVIGLTLEPLQFIADNNGVYVANHNTSRHFLLSGGKREISQAITEALACGAFSARGFDCDAPLHTPLVAQLDQELSSIFADYRYSEPACPLLDHLDQSRLTVADIPVFLLRELHLPVFWERTYRALCDAGATEFIEVGDGVCLSKFNRWIEGDLGASSCRKIS